MEYLEALGRQWTEVAAADQGEELLAALRVCLQQLTDRARQALLMRFQDRATREQIATAVNLSPDGAKNLMQRAKKQLKDCIAQQIPVGK